ncbi:MAG: DUF5050 domain-containing protein [Syntrophomonas sp.]
MKRKSGIIIVLCLMLTMGCMVVPPPALAWEDWPSAGTDDPNHTWTIVFEQTMNMSTINNQNIYVSSDSSGTKRIAGVVVKASDSTHAQVSPPTGGWSNGITYYLIITQNVLTSQDEPLKDIVRMPFSLGQNTNTQGNNINGGIACQKADWIYYAPSYGGLYRSHLDGTGTETIDNSSLKCGISSINVLDDKVFFSMGFHGELNCINIKNKQIVEIDGNWHPYDVIVSGDWIYFTPNYMGIYRVKTDGSAVQKLNDSMIQCISIADNLVYYSSENQLYTMQLDGSHKKKISNIYTQKFNIIGNLIYYNNVKDGYKIYCALKDGSSPKKINQDKSWGLIVSGEWIYYANPNDKNKIYRVRIDGTGREKLNDDDSRFINVIGDWIFYRNWSDGDKMYRMHTDGSERTLIG